MTTNKFYNSGILTKTSFKSSYLLYKKLTHQCKIYLMKDITSEMLKGFSKFMPKVTFLLLFN
jgi:hypothetical protein